MSTPVKGDPSIDEKVRKCLQDLESLSTSETFRNLDSDTLKYGIKVTNGFSSMASEWLDVRHKQSLAGVRSTSQRKIEEARVGA